MREKLMITKGYKVASEQELKHAVRDFISQHPNFTHDGASVKDIVKMYRKRTKPYKHIVFINMEENWFIQFLTDEEILHYIPLG